MASTNRDSVRASVFDICLQLGALDQNSLVAQWMFDDPSSDSGGGDDRTITRQESIALEWEDTGMVHNEHIHIPFSIRASAFAARFRPKARIKPRANPATDDKVARGEFGVGHGSLNRRSLFRRTMRKSSEHQVQDHRIVPSSHIESENAPTIPRSFFRRKTRSAAEPPIAQKEFATSSPIFNSRPRANSQLPPDVQVLPDSNDDDDSWEVVEARPQSPLYALHNKGINPPPAVLRKKRPSGSAVTRGEDTRIRHRSTSFSLPRSIFRPGSKRQSRASRPLSVLPTSHARPSRKTLSIQAQSPRVHSTSLPSSPIVPVTPVDMATNSDAKPSPPASPTINTPSTIPASKISFVEAQRPNMGYHNQFFVTTPPRPSRYPPLPKASSPVSAQPGRKIPFPLMPS